MLADFEAFQEECEQSWFTLDFGLLVRFMVVEATHQCLFRTVGSTPISKLKDGWFEAKEGLRFAINFLRTNAGIEDESLSSPFFIVLLAAVMILCCTTLHSPRRSHHTIREFEFRKRGGIAAGAGDRAVHGGEDADEEVVRRVQERR